MPKICTVTDCDSPVIGRGWCQTHYRRWQRNGNPQTIRVPRGTPEERFWAKIARTAGCWTWTGASSNGYGVFTIRTGKTVKVHRFAYELLVEPIPDGMQLDHLCRNRRCINPEHLEVVTQQENLRRGDAGLHHTVKTHCPYGHPYDEINTILLASGSRACRECSKRRKREYRARMKADED